MARHLYIALVAALSFSAYSNALAEEAPRFYERKSEGWFWYAPEPVEEEPAPPPEIPQLAVEPPVEEQPAHDAATPAGPAPFTAEWLRENLPKYRDAAWDNPTIENVRAFMYLQRFAMDRSQQFADVAELAVIGDPFLDEVSRRPSATFATQSLDRIAGAERGRLLSQIAERVGLFFFFRGSDCPACDVQAPLIKALEDSEGFAVVPISVDGKPLAGGEFPAYRVDQGQAAALGIETLPAMFLVSPEGEFAAIGQGVLSLSDLGHRILIASRRHDWVTEDEFNRTRPVLNWDTNIAERLAGPLNEADIADLAQTHAEPDSNTFIPPDKLLEHIRAKLQGK